MQYIIGIGILAAIMSAVLGEDFSVGDFNCTTGSDMPEIQETKERLTGG